MSNVYFLIYDNTDCVDCYATLSEALQAADVADANGIDWTLEIECDGNMLEND